MPIRRGSKSFFRSHLPGDIENSRQPLSRRFGPRHGWRAERDGQQVAWQSPTLEHCRLTGEHMTRPLLLATVVATALLMPHQSIGGANVSDSVAHASFWKAPGPIVVAAPPVPVAPAQKGVIAFLDYCTRRLYAIRGDGTGRVALPLPPLPEPATAFDYVPYIVDVTTREHATVVYRLAIIRRDGSEPPRLGLYAVQVNDAGPGLLAPGPPVRLTLDDDLWLVRLTSGHALDTAEQLTNTDNVVEWNPSYSPDGLRVAYTGGPVSRDGTVRTTDLYAIAVFGGAVTRITSTTRHGQISSPDNAMWAAGGTWIGFAAYTSGTVRHSPCSDAVNSEIFLINADGSGTAFLITDTHGTSVEALPKWG
jgi:hypothetical protein